MSETLYFIAVNMYYELVHSSFSSYVVLQWSISPSACQQIYKFVMGLQLTGLKLGMAGVPSTYAVTTAMAVIHPPEKKLAKRTSVHCVNASSWTPCTLLPRFPMRHSCHSKVGPGRNGFRVSRYRHLYQGILEKSFHLICHSFG